MRRMNPRDTTMAQLADVNVHRIIRRSTTYGAPYDPDATSEQDDEVARGLYFIFLSAKAMATMEFLQQEWINNGNFMNLGDERDPHNGNCKDVNPQGDSINWCIAPQVNGLLNTQSEWITDSSWASVHALKDIDDYSNLPDDLAASAKR